MPADRNTPAPLVAAAAVLAAALPALLAYNQPPSATLLNQCLAVAMWGGYVMLLAPGAEPRDTQRTAWTLQAALALVAAAAMASWAWGSLPWSLACGSLGVLVSAMVCASAGAAAARRGDAATLWAMLAAGLLLTGVLSSLVALVQVFAPELTDGRLIAHSGLVGRAVGNLRQPNHLCSLLVWALVALVSLHELRRLPTAWLWPLAVLLVLAIELSASRTGAVALLLLPAWAWLDRRRLSAPARALLLAAPLMYLVAYGAMAAYGHYSQQAVGAGARVAVELGAAESPNARSNIWRNALVLVARHPWTGVGYGEFNFAWTLTPFAGRPTAFFDHTHDLPLQLMVELGLPLSLTVMGLMAWALLLALRRSAAASGDAGAAARAALMVALVIGLHSLVEYPLWYSYFLLPAAFAWGFALAVPAAASAATTPMGAGVRWGAVAGVLMLVGGMAALQDYRHAVAIYAPDEGDDSTLEQRIARGQLSPLFAHHADYAAATTEGLSPAMRRMGLLRAPHNLLDTRLMMAWARDLAANGRLDEARALAERIREFHHADADAFFAPCTASAPASATAAGQAAGRAASAAARPFQCQPPSAAVDWRGYALPSPRLPAGGPADQPASATQ